MQIHLKQNEIEAALKLFVSQQGINLANKTITMEFTAGRKESGISVEMSIEEKQYDSQESCAKNRRISDTEQCSTPSTTIVGPVVASTEAEPQPTKVASLFK